MTRPSAAERMRPGSIFVTVLCPLASDTFELVEEVELNFSWGAVECLAFECRTKRGAAAASGTDSRTSEDAGTWTWNGTRERCRAMGEIVSLNSYPCRLFFARGGERRGFVRHSPMHQTLRLGQ